MHYAPNMQLSKMVQSDSFGAATIVTACTSSVYGCDQTLLQQALPIIIKKRVV